MPRRIPSVIPTVVTPILNSHDQVQTPISVVVRISPLIVPHFGAFALFPQRFMKLGLDGQQPFFGCSSLSKIHVLRARRQDTQRFAIVARHDIVSRLAQKSSGFEDGHLIGRRETARILKQPNAVRRFVWARYDQIKIAVSVRIARNGPSPQTNSKIDNKSWMIVLQRLKRLCG